ncbi:hypothetical protein CLV30_12712 [Haloactinopolyspora alba]|uniref:Glycosyl hydrolase family 16 n=1 Tax=Haloactinopolyspora alba TaxID=648780 RepID=A0A2P8DFT4_9ACTN|nr:DUF6081 family protein [Haloactinopolyspora alba]PSK96071.1 hypothetical protein CLV30_12712 [Haloactinopolyspora alba]
MTIYDDLSSQGLRDDRWTFLEIPQPGADPWRYAEPHAVTEVDDGVLSITVETFTRSHSDVQILDNPKHLLVSVDSFDVTAGPRTFSVDMSAENLGATGEDYRDGFAAFNVLEMATGRVFDLAATSQQPYAIHERLFVPGMIPQEEAFTHMVHAPLSGLDFKPHQFHHYAISFDPGAGTVTWAVDDTVVYSTGSATMPSTVQIGFGMFTLHPIRDGRSTSLRGQGLRGRWRNFVVD